MRIAVTGRTGQVVTSLIERGAAAGHEVIAVGRPELDLADPASVLSALDAARPDAIVSAAGASASCVKCIRNSRRDNAATPGSPPSAR